MKKSQKVLFGVFGAVAAVLLVVVGAVLLAINYNVSSAPTAVIFVDGKNIHLKTEATEEYKGYRFKFVCVGDNSTFYIDSEVNNILLSDNDKIVPGTTYDISVCYLGEIEGSNSKFSDEVRWTAYAYLDAPTVSVLTAEDKLVWTSVPHAASYTVFYGEEGQSIIVPASDACELSLQKFSGGRYDEVFVVANAGSTLYRKSQPSNIVSVTVYHRLQPVKVDFDRAQMLMTVTSEDDLDAINVYIDSRAYKVIMFEKSLVAGGAYEYKFNIHGIYREGARLGAAPCGNEYNVYVGTPTYYEPAQN